MKKNEQENPKNCKTCNNTKCDYFKYKYVQYGVYNNELDVSLALTPSTFTSKMGCISWKEGK